MNFESIFDVSYPPGILGTGISDLFFELFTRLDFSIFVGSADISIPNLPSRIFSNNASSANTVPSGAMIFVLMISCVVSHVPV